MTCYFYCISHDVSTKIINWYNTMKLFSGNCIRLKEQKRLNKIHRSTGRLSMTSNYDILQLKQSEITKKNSWFTTSQRAFSPLVIVHCDATLTSNSFRVGTSISGVYAPNYSETSYVGLQFISPFILCLVTLKKRIKKTFHRILRVTRMPRSAQRITGF